MFRSKLTLAFILAMIPVLAIYLVSLGGDDGRISKTSSARAESAAPTAMPEATKVQEVLEDNWLVVEIVTRDGQTYLVFERGVNVQKGEALLTGSSLEALPTIKQFDRVNVSYVLSDGPLVVTEMSKVVIRPPCYVPSSTCGK